MEELNDSTYSMEWIEGSELTSIRDKSIIKNELDFVRMAVILSQHLDILHSNSFFHCDIKPANIMVKYFIFIILRIFFIFIILRIFFTKYFFKIL